MDESALGLSVIVPVYNEAANLPPLIEEMEKHLPNPFQVLIVYDFEEDTTLPVARQLAETRPHMKLVKNDIGRGPANALRAGFQAVESGPALVAMADLSDDLEDVPAMLELYRERVPSCVCFKIHARREADWRTLGQTHAQPAGGALIALLGRLADARCHQQLPPL